MFAGISESRLIGAVKGSITQRNKEFAAEYIHCEYTFSKTNGADTKLIAQKLGVKTGVAKKALDAAFSRGLVYKHSHSNFCNWWPVGYLKELNSLF